MTNSSYNTLYSTAQYKTIQKMTTALWIDVFCQQSHSRGQPFLQAQPHCICQNSENYNMNLHCCKPEAVAVVVSTAEFTNYQNYNEYYWKGCETFFHLYANWCNYIPFSFLPKGYLFSWDKTLIFPPLSADLNHMPSIDNFIPYQEISKP